MRAFIVLLGVTLAAATGRAEAGVLGEERIELRPPTITVQRLEPPELAPSPWCLPLPIFRFSAHVWEADDLRGPIRLALPEMGPECLDLEIREGRILFKVGAEMYDNRAPVTINCRLDCDSRETYFWVRLQYDATDSLSLFCESFQAAGSILGTDTIHATQSYVWDGFQVQGGLRWTASPRLTLEGGPIVYTFSATRQAGGLGGRVGLRLEF
jgi:hypothetical protein